jgi:hypothetical protein
MVASIRREPVPFRSFGIVACNAVAVGVELSQQRHRFDIAFLLDAPRRNRKCGHVEATLIGPIGHVRLMAVAWRRNAHGSWSCLLRWWLARRFSG